MVFSSVFFTVGLSKIFCSFFLFKDDDLNNNLCISFLYKQ